MILTIKFTSVSVRDPARAHDFFVDVLGFELVTDQPMGPGMSWIEVKSPERAAGLALFTAPVMDDRIGKFTGISFECDVKMTAKELRV